MKDICDKLDAELLALFPNDGINFAGLCQLVGKGDQPHPVTVEDNKQISIDDRWDVLLYHRLNGTAQFVTSDEEEQDFGRSTGRVFSQPMITVIVHKVKKGEEWIYDFLQGWPEDVSVTNANGGLIYDFVDIDEIALDTEQEEIYSREFGATDYEKHRIPWNIYAVEYSIDFKRC